jgi:radical SAM protein with 4Fe4S-binding SPASM domain
MYLTPSLNFLNAAAGALDQEVAGVILEFSKYVEGLPKELQSLTATPLWRERGEGLSHWLPFWLNLEFAGGALLPQARQMALANRFGQMFCLLQDGVIDGDTRIKPNILMLIDTFFFHFVHGYQNIFSSTHPFWIFFESYWQDYLQALAWEWVQHHGCVSPYTLEDFAWLGRKFSPVKICCTGMAMLANRDDEIPHLEAAIDHCQRGYQILDDLKDWKEDLEKGNYTYPLTLVHLLHATETGEKLPVEEVDRFLWTKGIGQDVLSQAIELFTQAEQDIAHLSLLGFNAMIRDLESKARQWAEQADRDQGRQIGYPQLKLFSLDDQHVVLNVQTIGLFHVDETATAFLKQMESNPERSIDPDKEESLAELQAAHVFDNLPPPCIREGSRLTTLQLIIAQSNGPGGSGQNHNGQLMSREVGERAVDILFKEASDGNPVRIVFTGQDPLDQIDILVGLMAYSTQQAATAGKDLRFHLVTGKTALKTDTIDFLAHQNISVEINIVLDRSNSGIARIDPNEGWQRMANNIRTLRQEGIKDITIRVPLNTLAATSDWILEQLVDMGIAVIIPTTTRPVPESCSNGMSEEELAQIKHAQEYTTARFLNGLRQGQIIPYLNLWVSLIRLARSERVVYPCLAGVAMAAVTPNGSIFPCQHLTGESALAIGSVFVGLDHKQTESYSRSQVDQFPICRRCWAHYLCGGCPRCAYFGTNGDIKSPNLYRCNEIKHHWQVVIQLLARSQQECPELLSKIIKTEAPESFSLFMECNE